MANEMFMGCIKGRNEIEVRSLRLPGVCAYPEFTLDLVNILNGP
jgi:hypothetical protein